jgi:hypothetical protein
MVDREVESILREIRERVQAEQQELAAVSHRGQKPAANNSPVISNGERLSESQAALARIEGHLTTTARAWDRLPPLVSNRSGGLARLELWVKRHLKRATRWYAWEQINFNAAVHHALRDMLETFSTFEQQLQQLRTDSEAWAQKFEQTRLELQAQRAQIELQRAETESQGRMQSLEMNARLAELAQELRRRDEHLLDEQRVCLKQLSLEISEASTLFDRARRQLESRLDQLESNK